MGRQRFAAICLAAAAALWSLAIPAGAQPFDQPYGGTVPAALRGPFISDPEVIALLDQVSPKGCGESGALVFGCLFQGQARMENQQAFGDRRQNPFRLGIADRSGTPSFNAVLLPGSSNAPNLGTCLPPEGTFTVGDPLQFGSVESTAFGSDHYQRLAPTGDSTLIEVPKSLVDPPGNSFYAAHQEYYRGIKTTTTRGKPIVPTTWKMARDIRDAQTGGFPGGMLRLSECTNLPGEATCGLTAANGFNTCINDPTRKVTDCFLNHTAYAGLRACDAATPCRDDYICLQPITGKLIAQRGQSASASAPYRFGVAKPDDTWLARFSGAGDQRGYCMPPYFVLQFRVDGHPEQ